ncbi:integral membrane protein DGCR2/IDD-like, partial [Pollicipes pollicipes]|uniref:integral membrane protein DGCR2/IDD-like n=1 Tax=Pollicipes pollicipes TaxID=41117 RepID=UPI0018851A50
MKHWSANISEMEIAAEPRLCLDLNGRTVRNSERYIPGPDECTVCTCHDGEQERCQSVMCAPPRACRQYQVGKTCCEFICLDGSAGASPVTPYGERAGTGKDLGLRLVA